MSFTHLHVHSNFSFYEGAAPLDDLVSAAARLEMPAVAVTDHHTLASAVRFYRAATAAGVQPLIGVEFDIEPIAAPTSPPAPSRDPGGEVSLPYRLVLLAEDNEGYRSLCRLVTCAQLGEARSAGPFAPQYQQVDRKRPFLRQEHLRQYAGHLIGLCGGPASELAAALQRRDRRAAARVARYYADLLGPDGLYLELQHHRQEPQPEALRYQTARLAAELHLPVVATNDVHYVTRDFAPLQDALYCLGQGVALGDHHPGRLPNQEYYLKSPAQMARLFADLPAALAATEEIATRCRWTLDLETTHLPKFAFTEELAADPGVRVPLPTDPEAPTARSDFLRRLCEEALERKYAGSSFRARARRQLAHELEVINERGLADYFLIVWDLVRFAEQRGIRHTGRGSAADSLVCYLLDLTQPEPLATDLLFERFLNPERRDLPDVDLDFDAHRRDEVVAYVYRRYGAEHVAAVGTVNTFRARAAVRELGKVLGMREGQLRRLSQNFGYVDLRRLETSLQDLPETRTLSAELAHEQTLLGLCEQVARFPRHLAVHVGGLIISGEPLTDLVPLQLANKGIVVAQYDKDDVEALGLLKMDLLGLRIHTAIEHSLQLLRQGPPRGTSFDLERVPLDDPRVYELIRSTNTIGLFQLESPGQRNLQGRVLGDCFEDIIATISLFRPGPVQADMITPFVARRRGREPVRYHHPSLRPILERTWGVLIYQEQVMRVAAAIGGFSLGQADQLRKAMDWSSHPGYMEQLQAEFMDGAERQGIALPTAEAVFREVSAFAAFGFNKAHAASFARISYESAYLKTYFPAEFIAGLLTAQPMGFYPARTLAEEAKRLGIRLLPPCVNRSEADYTVEYAPALAIRCGLRGVREMTGPALEQIRAERRQGGAFLSLRDFLARTRVPWPTVENLIRARAFDFSGASIPSLLGLLAARQGRSAARHLSLLDADLDLLETSTQVDLGEEITPYQRLQLDLHLLGLSTGLNPFAPWVEMTQRQGVTPTNRLLELRPRAPVRVAGIVVARARPPVRSGRTTVFICLEDQAGLVDITIYQDAYQKYGSFLYTAPVLMAEGELSRRGERDVAVIVRRLTPLPFPPSRRVEAGVVSPEDFSEAYAQTGPGSYGT
ncbi:MAG TPA: DNA polymerase III subunit alpha [Armatimonadota bacterium]|jgi:error-prone DNA polymerase